MAYHFGAVVYHVKGRRLEPLQPSTRRCTLGAQQAPTLRSGNRLPVDCYDLELDRTNFVDQLDAMLASGALATR